MIWAYDTRTGNAVEMIGRAGAVAPGTCGTGCWPETHDGKIICVCSDTLLQVRSRFRQRGSRSLSGGIWEGAKTPLMVLGVLGVVIGGIFLLRRAGHLSGGGSRPYVAREGDFAVKWHGGTTFNVLYGGREIDVFSYHGSGEKPTRAEAIAKAKRRVREYAEGS